VKEILRMKNAKLNVLDAIQIALEAEQKAAAFYTDAASQVSNPLGRRLFEQLVKFEQHHYDKLAALQQSLHDKGAFIGYEGRELDLPPLGEVEGIEEANLESVMGIIDTALEVEQGAEKRYADLAEQTDDPEGHAMFERLSEEEHGHYRILREAYWSLNNGGVWHWSQK
jgi:rubrerythrin